MIKKVHHIAIAVKDLDKSMSLYTDLLGLKSRVLDMPNYHLKIAFIEVGEVLIELLQPTREDDPFGFDKFIKENGGGLHHIAYEVEDVRKTIRILMENRIRMRNEEPVAGADGMIAFAEKESTDGVLMEFVERPKE